MTAKSKTSKAADNPVYLTPYPEVEKWLGSWKVAYQFGYVDFADVNVKLSLENQARIQEPLDRDMVDRYADQITQGADFPAIVLYDINGNKNGMMVVDGNHRAGAAIQAGLTEFPAFVLHHDTHPKVITAMTMQANARHGMPTSEQDRTMQAMWLVDGGMSVAEAATTMGVRKALVQAAKADREGNRRATECNIDSRRWDEIPRTARNRLLAVSTDEGFVAAVDLVAEAGLKAPDIEDMVSKLNGHRSARAQEGLVSALRDAYTEKIQLRRAGDRSGERGVAQGRSPATRWLMTIGAIVHLPKVEDLATALPPAQRKDFLDRLQHAVGALTEELKIAQRVLALPQDEPEQPSLPIPAAAK